VFLSTFHGQQSHLVCCHNDTLACSTSGFLTISSVSRIVHILSLVVPAAVCLIILGSLGAIIIVQWAQWSPDCKMWNHSASMYDWRYRQQSFWN